MSDANAPGWPSWFDPSAPESGEPPQLPCGYCSWTFGIPDNMTIMQALAAVRDHQAAEHAGYRPQVIVLGG